MRPGFFTDSATIFLKNVLLLPESAGLNVPTDADGRPLPFLHALMHARLNAHDDFGARLFGDEHGMPHHHSPFAERMPPEAMFEVDAEEEMLRAAIAASLHDRESGCAPSGGRSPATPTGRS